MQVDKPVIVVLVNGGQVAIDEPVNGTSGNSCRGI
jgi:hypothetical protein